jgi:hypothetical protein
MQAPFSFLDSVIRSQNTCRLARTHLSGQLVLGADRISVSGFLDLPHNVAQRTRARRSDHLRSRFHQRPIWSPRPLRAGVEIKHFLPGVYLLQSAAIVGNSQPASPVHMRLKF